MIRRRKGGIISSLGMLTATLITLLVAESPGPSLSQGRTWAKQLSTGASRSLWASAGPGLKRQLGSRAGLEAFSSKVRRSFGDELRVISEGLVARGELTVYRRVSAYSRWARGVELEFGIDEDGAIASVSVKPAAAAAPTTSGAKKTQATLRLPVEGPWFVLWGGRTWADNRHAAVSDMRYALDLLISRGGSSTGNGTRNEQYHCWGKPVVAPADGVVVVAQDGQPDNEPNHPSVASLYGNYVVLDHGTGEFSLIGHLQKGSVQVRVGDRVTSGRMLARTGNSGMSTEPHVHYQLMDNADWLVANGLPAQFQNFLRDGKLVDRGEPRRPDTVEHVDLSASNAF